MNIATLLSSKATNTFTQLFLRLSLGAIFIAHGGQKLFAWFNGYGLQGTAQWMDSIGLSPGYLMATLAGSAEFFGGLALLMGLLTRPAAAILAFTMAVALVSTHLHNGLLLSNNGFEYALALLAACLLLAAQGAGKLSLDHYIHTYISR